MTEQLTTWFASLFSDNVSHEIIIFLTSLFPILECRGGMILAKLFEINFLLQALLHYEDIRRLIHTSCIARATEEWQMQIAQNVDFSGFGNF